MPYFRGNIYTWPRSSAKVTVYLSSVK